MSMIIIINEPPSSSKTWNALRITAALLSNDEDVEIFLMNDGVFNALHNQNPPDEIKGQSTSEKIKQLVEIGAKAFYCSQCAETRGITKDQINPEIEKSNLIELSKKIQTTSKTINM